MRGLILLFGERYGYNISDVLIHITESLAELSAGTANTGQEAEARESLLDMVRVQLEISFDEEAQRRASESTGPKEPTVQGCGHA